MPEGFETKSADTLQNSRNQRKPVEMADIGSIQQSLVEQFALIQDPRVERTKKHQLIDNRPLAKVVQTALTLVKESS